MVGKTNSGQTSGISQGSDDLVKSIIERTISDITIPNGTTVIGPYMFFGCSRLTSITIPDGVTSIGDEAFRNCTSLTDVTIPDSVTSIRYGAFNQCTSLADITIPDNVTSIGDSAFSYCTSLTSITIPNNVTSIGFGAFSECTSLNSLTIPDSVTSIGEGAFYNTSYYNNTNNWQNDLLYIGNHLIKANETVTTVDINLGTKTIADVAFVDCTNLTSITIPNSVTSIGYAAFLSCSSLINVTIEQGFNANNLDLRSSTLYTVETIISWLNALYDRTGLDTYTLTIGDENLAKLTEEQIAIATAKNWTLA